MSTRLLGALWCHARTFDAVHCTKCEVICNHLTSDQQNFCMGHSAQKKQLAHSTRSTARRRVSTWSLPISKLSPRGLQKMTPEKSKHSKMVTMVPTQCHYHLQGKTKKIEIGNGEPEARNLGTHPLAGRRGVSTLGTLPCDHRLRLLPFFWGPQFHF